MQVTPSVSPPVRTLLDVAHGEVGVHEEGGDNRGKRIEEYQFAVDHVAKGQSWCMCFVQWCLMQAEKKTGLHSDVHVSDNCQAVWMGTEPILRTQTPEPGAIVIWRKVNGSGGHCGIVEAIDAENHLLLTIEGNTGNANVSDGDCVARKKRPLSGPHGFAVIGYIRPFWASAMGGHASADSHGTP